MTESTYNESIDIWSAGLVLSELMKCTNDQKENLKQKNILFKGKSCFPISPAEGSGDSTVYETDQIFKIIEKYPDINIK